MAVNIQAKFGKDDRESNGLERIAKELIDEPMKRRIVVGFIEPTRVTTDLKDGGTQSVTVNFLQIEPLEGDVAERARMMLSEAYTARTGQAVEETLFDHQQGDEDDDQDDED
jgi:hypothetical protein